MNTPVVCLIFRKKVPDFFSIEKVFDTISCTLKKTVLIQTFNAPFVSGSLLKVARNIFSVRRVRADLYHITGDIHYMVFGLPRSKTVLTIHDCVFIYQSKGLKKLLFHRLFLKWPVRYCKLVTTISEQTKQDIVKYAGVTSDKILVIPNPVTKHIRFSAHVFRSEKPVLLFIGTTPNKNLERVIPAIAGIPCLLDIIGKIPAGIEVLLRQYSIEYRNAFSLDEKQMASKYMDADMILFPSTFEGFGLPIIEGQKAGRVVITSNISPMKDVAGGGACLVDPDQIESIRQGVFKVIKDSDYRTDLIQKGLVNAKKYEAEIIADRYLDVYKRILN